MTDSTTREQVKCPPGQCRLAELQQDSQSSNSHNNSSGSQSYRKLFDQVQKHHEMFLEYRVYRNIVVALLGAVALKVIESLI